MKKEDKTIVTMMVADLVEPLTLAVCVWSSWEPKE